MRLSTVMLSVASGAALMYLFDPMEGERRRARLRERLAQMQQAQGAGGYNMGGQPLVDDETLAKAVRKAVRGVIPNGRGVSVGAQGGRIVLSGRVPTADLDRLKSAVLAVPGVVRLEDRLEVFAEQVVPESTPDIAPDVAP